jgi:methylphosphotriester-DNA--protein-cysteine methyltransferase
MKKGSIFVTSFVVLLACAGFLFSSAAMAADTATAAPKKAAQKKEVVYVASKGSDKYHLPTCAMAANIKPENKITFKTKAEADKAGYKPCGVCFKK